MSNHRSNYKGYSEQRRNKVVPYIAAVLSLTLFGAPGTVGAAEGGTSIQDLRLAPRGPSKPLKKLPSNNGLFQTVQVVSTQMHL